MWSYKYTSAASVFVDQCRVGVRFEAATPTTQLVALADAVTKEQVRDKHAYQPVVHGRSVTDYCTYTCTRRQQALVYVPGWLRCEYVSGVLGATSST